MNSRNWTYLGVLLCSVLFTLGLTSCGSSSDPEPPEPPPPPPPPPAASIASISLDGSSEVAEETNPQVTVNVSLDSPSSNASSVVLTLGGTATVDSDYAISASTLAFAANSSSASAQIDVYRDFESEENETIDVSLGAVTGNIEVGSTSSVTITVLDGPEITVSKEGRPPDFPDFSIPFDIWRVGVNEQGLTFDASVIPPAPGETHTLVIEWSPSEDFGKEEDAREVGRKVVEGAMSTDFVMPESFQLVLPKTDVPADQIIYVRAYIKEFVIEDEFGPLLDFWLKAFAVDSQGEFKVTCEVSDRTPNGTSDPLLEHQWFINNTGQSSFAMSGGVVGADLNMSDTISRGLNGEGVVLGIVDQGLEICHPDLEANVLPDGSHNFAFEHRLGAILTDPFHFHLDGDHGTAVSGVAAAAANNGYGGRGVAPEASIVVFNPLEALDPTMADPTTVIPTAFIESLGGSDSAPDSSVVDVFNLSFGILIGPTVIQQELDAVFKFGTEELRNQLGAVYIKAAGNDFEFCDFQPNPVPKELGCTSSIGSPEQNIPQLINVGAFNADDRKSSFSSVGSNLWVVAPAGEEAIQKPGLITTDQMGVHAGYSQFPDNQLSTDNPLNLDGDYTSNFGGTSGAAPAAAGVVAILLAEKPTLTWRDVKHILARSARKIDPDIAETRIAFNGTPFIANPPWIENAAGFNFHSWYGFGAIDVDAAVAMTNSYTPNSLGEMMASQWFDSGTADTPLEIPDYDGMGVSTTFSVQGLPDSANIEAVILEWSINHTHGWDLGVNLTSPSGTLSTINPLFHDMLMGHQQFENWPVLANAYYGESPNGEWTLHIVDAAVEDTGSLTGARLRIYYGEHP